MHNKPLYVVACVMRDRTQVTVTCRTKKAAQRAIEQDAKKRGARKKWYQVAAFGVSHA